MVYCITCKFYKKEEHDFGCHVWCNHPTVRTKERGKSAIYRYWVSGGGDPEVMNKDNNCVLFKPTLKFWRWS